MGGTLTLTSNEGWEHLDPGASYFQIDYVVVYATQTPAVHVHADERHADAAARLGAAPDQRRTARR